MAYGVKWCFHDMVTKIWRYKRSWNMDLMGIRFLQRLGLQPQKQLIKAIPGLRPWEVLSVEQAMDQITYSGQWYREPLGAFTTGTIVWKCPEQLRQFVIEAVTTNIDESQGWYFNRCRTFHMKISERFSHRHCQPPGVQLAPTYTYSFRATVADVTGSIIVTCFSPEANSLLLPITEMLSYIPDPDPQHKFILDHAADAPPPALPDIPIPSDLGCSSTTDLPESEEQVLTEMPMADITPPPNTDDAAKKKGHKNGGTSQKVQPSATEIEKMESTPPVDETSPTPVFQEPDAPVLPASVASEEDKPLTQATKKAKHD
ncbi:hypothetical protein CTI12_AA558580 [Artemisia annua]|uniref:Nucleic acid-binding, OB-fold protein n=1 Tax=Artemisia annua TaxID=35608 RepID=A0A2U1KVQ5_ARTAN|nr:hypothetical protein CTI12_AA558580 [Artemisia annua]